MPITIACPFCNTPIPMPELPDGENRIQCPRCDETLPIHVTNVHTSAEDFAASTAPVGQPSSKSRPTNRAVAGLVVAIMLGMAALGLAFALQTKAFRRANDSKGAVPPEPAPEAQRLAPAEWPGLGWIPDDVQAVAGIRIADARESLAGRALLAQLRFDGANQIKIAGLSPAAIDHLIVGAAFRALPPRVTGVIHTRGRIHEKTRSEPSRTSDQHGKTLIHGKLWTNGPDGAAWQADQHTLIAALLPEDFDKLPARPQGGIGRLAVPLSEVLAERLDPAAVAWLMVNVDANSPATAIATPFLPPVQRDTWAKLETLAVSIRADGSKLIVTVQLRAKDAAAGAAIAKALAESLQQPAAEIRVERTAFGDWNRMTATVEAEKLAELFKPR
jgi:hypothetical protein